MNTDDDTDVYVVIGATTSEWLPDAITTSVLSVFEIEMMIERLGEQYKIDAGNERFNGTFGDGPNPRTFEGIENWTKILKKYRDQTKNVAEKELTSIKTGLAVAINRLDVVYQSAATSYADYFKDFNTEMDNHAEFTSYLDRGLDKLNSIKEQAEDIVPNSGFNFLNIAGVISEASGQDFSNLGRILGGLSNVQTVSALASRLDATLNNAHYTNCNGPDPFQVGKLCETNTKLKEAHAVVRDLLGICDVPSVGLPAMTEFCKTDELTKDDGTTETIRAFDFLDNPDHLVTFGGGASVSLSYAISLTSSYGQATTCVAKSTFRDDVIF